MKNFNKMTKKELLNEYNSVCEHINYLSYDKWEIAYQWQLENEIEKRGYQLKTINVI